MKDDNDDKERRDVTRTRMSRSAKIIPPHRGSMIHCTVQNITSSGACLKLANTYGLPETFELTFEQGRTRRACRVVWRSNDELGVALRKPSRWRARPHTHKGFRFVRECDSNSVKEFDHGPLRIDGV